MHAGLYYRPGSLKSKLSREGIILMKSYCKKYEIKWLECGKIVVAKNKAEEEKNINTTLLLDPKNEEAMYILIDIELKRSNFSKAEELKKDFKVICSTMFEKLTSINSRLKEFEKKDAS